MEEKQYPHIEEEQDMDMACEPVADVAATSRSSVYGITEVHDWIDDLDWESLPVLGPKTEQEAINRIDKFEEKLARGEVKWISSEEVDRMLYQKYPWLR